MPNLMIVFLMPFVASILILLLSNLAGSQLKRFAFVLSLLPLAFLLYNHQSWIGSSVQYLWIPQISINFYLNVDPLSLVFLYLTSVIIPMSILSVRNEKLVHPGLLFGLILLMQGLLIGFFTVRDLAVFTIFWEAMLLPVYFIINVWGSADRQYAALKFLIYMIAGSALMVAAVLALYFASTISGSGTFNLDALAKISANAVYAPWICGIFLLAFAVKTPLFPFHAWLPDAYCQAPTVGTILLAGILSKAGIYGVLRIGISLFPEIIASWSHWLLGFAISGVLYGGLAAWMQNDFKRLIAYSSFSHVNFVLAGLFILNQTANAGAILQAVNHGITITALFLVAGWLEARLNSTKMNQAGGLAKYMPQLCWLTLFFVVAAVALPGTNNFVGELMIFYGLFGQNPWLAGVLGLSIILSVIYMLRFMRKIYFETPIQRQPAMCDISGKQLLIAFPLIALILWIGIYPKPVLDQIVPASQLEAVAKLENA